MTVTADDRMRALVVERAPEGDRWTSGIRDVDRGWLVGDELAGGEVLVRVGWSSLNFKDALVLGGAPGVARTSPLVPGIDVVGTVLESAHPDWSAGDEVVLNGAGAGETRHGGYAGLAAVPGDALVRVPEVFGPRLAAAIGTAGFTAALALDALERWGVPDGPVLVTGASGGVGSVAVALLAASGREVVAVTGKSAEHARLHELGASRIVDRAGSEEAGRPLQSRRWAAALDAVGGAVLHNVLAQTVWGGAVAAYGLAGDARLDTTVQPFILRGVSLLGVNSVDAPGTQRTAAWSRLARDLDPAVIERMTTQLALDELGPAAARIRDGQGSGRTVVRVGD